MILCAHAGLRRATVAQYTANFNADVATYRQTVLTAFQQVEDSIATLRVLSQQIAQQQIAVRCRALPRHRHEALQGRSQSLSQRHHRSDDVAFRPADRAPPARKPDDCCGPTGPGPRRRLGYPPSFPLPVGSPAPLPSDSWLDSLIRRCSSRRGSTVPRDGRASQCGRSSIAASPANTLTGLQESSVTFQVHAWL